MAVFREKASTTDDIVLKEYFVKYLKEVRNNSESTVKHYLDALNNISRFFQQMDLVKDSIYELTQIDDLLRARELLYANPTFTAQDNRGNRMYSSGLNNYCRFAQGEGFLDVQDWSCMDVPVEIKQERTYTCEKWSRSSILRDHTIMMADYSCELDESHESFISEINNHQYMEGHHIIPMSHQNEFDTSLDVYANLVSLCPVCHRKIHYGLRSDKTEMLKQIYETRNDRLVKCGIVLGKDEFLERIIG